MRYLRLELANGQIRDEKSNQTITGIGVTDENFPDLAMPYKINVAKYFKYV